MNLEQRDFGMLPVVSCYRNLERREFLGILSIVPHQSSVFYLIQESGTSMQPLGALVS